MFEPKSRTYNLDKKALIEMLQACEVNQILPYAALGGRITQTLTGASPILRAAIKAVERDAVMRFACERGNGIRRLDEHEVVDIGTHGIRKARRCERRSLKRMVNGVEDITQLPPERQATFNRNASLLALGMELFKDKALQKLKSHMNAHPSQLSYDETIRIARGI